MTWVILGHTYYYSLNESDNLMFVFEAFTKPFYQNIGNAVLSGKVKTYSFLVLFLVLCFVQLEFSLLSKWIHFSCSVVSWRLIFFWKSSKKFPRQHLSQNSTYTATWGSQWSMLWDFIFLASYLKTKTKFSTEYEILHSYHYTVFHWFHGTLW